MLEFVVDMFKLILSILQSCHLDYYLTFGFLIHAPSQM